MVYIPDDVSQIPDNHPDYITAPPDRRERLTTLMHKRLDQVIDRKNQPGLPRAERERLAAQCRLIREDIASIRYGAREGTVRDLERKYGSR